MSKPKHPCTDPRYDAACIWMIRRWPNVFSEKSRPLKVGICHDLVEIARSTPGSPRRDQIYKAVERYTFRLDYYKKCKEGAERIDLDGNACGTVTAKEEKYSQKRVWKILQAEGE